MCKNKEKCDKSKFQDSLVTSHNVTFFQYIFSVKQNNLRLFVITDEF